MNLVYDAYLKISQQQLELFTTVLGASARIWNVAATQAMNNALELARSSPLCRLEPPPPANFDALVAAQKRYFDAVKIAIVRPGAEKPLTTSRKEAHLGENDAKAPRIPVAHLTRDASPRL